MISIKITEDVPRYRMSELVYETWIVVRDTDKNDMKYVQVNEPYTRKTLAKGLIELGNLLLK